MWITYYIPCILHVCMYKKVFRSTDERWKNSMFQFQIRPYLLWQIKVVWEALQAAAQWAVMDFKLPIWRFLPFKGVGKRQRLCPGCVASLQHQPVSACWGENSSSGREWADIKRWNADSAAKLHPAEYDFISLASFNTLYTYIMFTIIITCISKSTILLFAVSVRMEDLVWLYFSK